VKDNHKKELTAMKKMIFLLILFGFFSLLADTLEEKMLSDAYTIKKNIKEFIDLNNEELFDDAEKDENSLKKLDEFVNKKITVYEKSLKETIVIYIKKKGYAAFEKFLKGKTMDIADIIIGVENGTFNLMNYTKGTVYYNYKSLSLLSNLIGEQSKENTEKGKKDSWDIIRKSKHIGNDITEHTFFRNNEPIAQHIFKDGIIYKIKGEKIEGIVGCYNEDGEFVSKTEYKSNIKNGKETSFYDSGNILMVSEWIDGKANGERRDFYENGQIKNIFNYREGIATGAFKTYYPTGVLSLEGSLKNDKFDGVFKYYSKNGNLSFEEVYENGKNVGTSKSYTTTGKISMLKEYNKKGGYIARYYFLDEVKYIERSDGEEPVVLDKETGLIWQKNHKDNSMRNPLSFCKDLDYGGYSDWRLPDIKELSTLINTSREERASIFPGILAENYLSSSKLDKPCDGGFFSKVKIVNFYDGEIDETCRLKNEKINYLCVRSSKKEPDN